MTSQEKAGLYKSLFQKFEEANFFYVMKLSYQTAFSCQISTILSYLKKCPSDTYISYMIFSDDISYSNMIDDYSYMTFSDDISYDLMILAIWPSLMTYHMIWWL